jgi:hypothetical protein
MKKGETKKAQGDGQGEGNGREYVNCKEREQRICFDVCKAGCVSKAAANACEHWQRWLKEGKVTDADLRTTRRARKPGDRKPAMVVGLDGAPTDKGQVWDGRLGHGTGAWGELGRRCLELIGSGTTVGAVKKALLEAKALPTWIPTERRLIRTSNVLLRLVAVGQLAKTGPVFHLPGTEPKLPPKPEKPPKATKEGKAKAKVEVKVEALPDEKDVTVRNLGGRSRTCKVYGVQKVGEAVTGAVKFQGVERQVVKAADGKWEPKA